MTVQAAIEAQLPFLRAEAEARMKDSWAIGTDLGWTYDPDEQADVQTVTPLFTTKGRMKSSRTYGNINQDAGGRTITTVTRELHIPVDSPAVPVNAVAQCTAIGEGTDPTLLGAIVRVAGPAPGSQGTARRLEVVEVLS